MSNNDAIIRSLWRQRPRDRFLRLSALLSCALVCASWASLQLDGSGIFSARRLANIARFSGELIPYPLRGKGVDLPGFAQWLLKLLSERGAEALLHTLCIAWVATILATLAGALMAFLAARNLMSPAPFLPDPRPPKRRLRVCPSTPVRGLLMLARGLPEYVWAFLFVGMLGPMAWPAVLALAIHNAGILGRLFAETIEDLPPARAAALRGLGAGRIAIAFGAILPEIFGRCLVYVFYRWETCVREATVLGLLGVVSLGYWIQDARARNHYDDMIAFVLLGSVLVLLGDLLSWLARATVRKAST